MPTAAAPAFAAAEKLHATSVGVAATLTIGSATIPARVLVKRGTLFTETGGSKQARKISAVVLCSALDDDSLLNADDENRGITITHVEGGQDYRLAPDGIQKSPHGVYWLLHAVQTAP